MYAKHFKKWRIMGAKFGSYHIYFFVKSASGCLVTNKFAPNINWTLFNAEIWNIIFRNFFCCIAIWLRISLKKESCVLINYQFIFSRYMNWIIVTAQFFLKFSLLFDIVLLLTTISITIAIISVQNCVLI